MVFVCGFWCLSVFVDLDMFINLFRVCLYFSVNTESADSNYPNHPTCPEMRGLTLNDHPDGKSPAPGVTQ